MDTADRVPGGTGIRLNDLPPAAVRSGAPRPRRLRTLGLTAAAAAIVVAGCTAGVAVPGSAFGGAASRSGSNAAVLSAYGDGGYGGYDFGGSGGYGDSADNGAYGYGGYSSGGSSSGSSGSTGLASATASQQVGVVDITSELTYDQAEAAGTGIVLSSDGEILTNNHVVEGATSISVTVVATGAQYTATVVGTDATDDIAVLKLDNASGLSTAHLDTSAGASVGDDVTGVGNAGGVGGTPSASPGTVTALDQSITTQAEGSAASETLQGLIETDADIQAGDSGGPLYNSSDAVIGIDTAAAAGGSTTAGYAIPIETALTIAGQITSGQASSSVTIGYPAFLGVQLDSSADAGSGSGGGFGYGVGGSVTPGAAVAGVVDGGPAASAGLAAGDTITAVNGSTIASAQDLSSALAAFTPGQRVSITWTGTNGASQTADVTLARGPVA
jgi:S1-C subfamily serine protease